MDAAWRYMRRSRSCWPRQFSTRSLLPTGSLSSITVNHVLGAWVPGPIPENFDAIRLRWETGHMIIAGIKAAGFISLVAGLLSIKHG